MLITRHAKQRMKERCGFNKSAMDRMAAIAYERGIKREDATGKLRKYMDKLYCYNEEYTENRVYGDKIFIFIDAKLITVIQLSPELKKAADFNRKRIRNCKTECL